MKDETTPKLALLSILLDGTQLAINPDLLFAELEKKYIRQFCPSDSFKVIAPGLLLIDIDKFYPALMNIITNLRAYAEASPRLLLAEIAPSPVTLSSAHKPISEFLLAAGCVVRWLDQPKAEAKAESKPESIREGFGSQWQRG